MIYFSGRIIDFNLVKDKGAKTTNLKIIKQNKLGVKI